MGLFGYIGIEKAPQMKEEIYYYEDRINRGMRIGIRGDGSEIFIPMWDIVRAEDSFRLHNGRSWTDEEALKWAIRWARKESEYTDFEEVPMQNPQKAQICEKN